MRSVISCLVIINSTRFGSWTREDGHRPGQITTAGDDTYRIADLTAGKYIRRLRTVCEDLLATASDQPALVSHCHVTELKPRTLGRG